MWNRIWSLLKSVLNIPDRKFYLTGLIDNLERQKEEGHLLAFRIVNIKSKGFVVKVGGLFAYGSFDHMPWMYPNHETWRVIFPYLTDRIFYCKIHALRKDPLFIIIDGNIPQFKKPQLKQNDLYIGIILNKVNYGLFIDIGFHFDWEYGSLVGLLHISAFNEMLLYDNAEAGQSKDVLFLGYNENDQLVFGSKPALEEWFTGELENRVGEMVWVKVNKIENNPPSFKVEGRYDASLAVTKRLYGWSSWKVAKAIQYLRHDEIIRCEILRLDSRRRCMELKWVLEWEIEAIASRSDKTKKSDTSRKKTEIREPLQNLDLIGKRVQVTVSISTDKYGRFHHYYLVENKYKGILLVENESYRLTKKEKSEIVTALQDGEVLECEVMGIDKDYIRVKWVIQ
ncbi:MAG: hypothetical protein IH596_03985 [Bacteroidales bacterium]|nr:hypothetical protein [Bacteroidales bacterium]